jgi:hypothetical protein
MNAFVVSGLIKRRAVLAGEIERTHEALRKMVLDLENLHATIFRINARASASIAGFSGPLSLPKSRFERIDGAARQGSDVRRPL